MATVVVPVRRLRTAHRLPASMMRQSPVRRESFSSWMSRMVIVRPFRSEGIAASDTLSIRRTYTERSTEHQVNYCVASNYLVESPPPDQGLEGTGEGSGPRRGEAARAGKLGEREALTGPCSVMYGHLTHE